MANSGHADISNGLAQSLELRLLSIDDFATMRYIHASAFKSMALSHYPDEEVAAFATYVYTPNYADLIRGENVLAG